MDAEQIALVQESFAHVLPIAPQAAALFYGRLFELDPALRPMFPDDMAEQRKKLMDTLRVAVEGLNRLESVLPAIQSLGRRHGGYGVTHGHYATVAAALLWTLEQGLGSQWNPPLAAAWTDAYTLIADTMQAAADGPA